MGAGFLEILSPDPRCLQEVLAVFQNPVSVLEESPEPLLFNFGKDGLVEVRVVLKPVDSLNVLPNSTQQLRLSD